MERDQELRDDVRLLGRLLGEVVAQQAGRETYELVERIRQEALEGRRIGDSGQLVASLDALGVPDDMVVVQRGDVARAKPEPDLFIECAKRLEVEPEDCYVIGDAVWDLLAARRARMLSIGLLSGGYGADELQGAGAFRTYRDAAELQSSLDELGV